MFYEDTTFPTSLNINHPNRACRGSGHVFGHSCTLTFKPLKPKRPIAADLSTRPLLLTHLTVFCQDAGVSGLRLDGLRRTQLLWSAERFCSKGMSLASPWLKGQFTAKSKNIYFLLSPVELCIRTCRLFSCGVLDTSCSRVRLVSRIMILNGNSSFFWHFEHHKPCSSIIFKRRQTCLWLITPKSVTPHTKTTIYCIAQPQLTCFHVAVLAAPSMHPNRWLEDANIFPLNYKHSCFPRVCQRAKPTLVYSQGCS